MIRILAALCIAAFLPIVACGQHEQPKSEASTEPVVDMSKMKTYYMGFLKRGPNRSQDSTSAMELQMKHLEHMSKLHKEGKLVMAGPFLDDGEIRGIVVYDVESIEEAVRLTNMDPAVKAGRLTVEVHPWMAERGTTLP